MKHISKHINRLKLQSLNNILKDQFLQSLYRPAKPCFVKFTWLSFATCPLLQTLALYIHKQSIESPSMVHPIPWEIQNKKRTLGRTPHVSSSSGRGIVVIAHLSRNKSAQGG